MTLEEMIESAARVSEMAFAKFGKIEAHWYVVTRTGERPIIPALPIGKRKMAALVRGILEQMDAVQVVFVDEAWSVLCETPAQEQALNAWYETHDSLEDFPGRHEIVLFSAEDEDGRLLNGSREIQRGPGWVSLAPLKFDAPRATTGQLTGWLPARGTKQ